MPVSAARVLGARMVIAVNLSSDILGRSVTILGEKDDAPIEPPPERHGFRRIFGAEQALKRQFVGGGRRPGSRP